MNLSSCVPAADRAFGPQVHGCRADFDFTLMFEESFLSIAPSSLFLAVVPLRLWYLCHKTVKADGKRLQATKLAAISTLCLLNLVLLIFWSTKIILRTPTTIPAAALRFADTIGILVLSHLEHERSIRPSSILNTYLAISLLFDVAVARTLWLLDGIESIAIIFTVATSLKLVVLLLEAHGKAPYLRVPFSFFPPEAISGIFSRSVFWWLNPLLKRGFGSILAIDDLYVLDHELSSELLYGSLWKRWTSTEHTHRHALLINVVAFLKWSWMSIALSRFCLIAFTYSQPFLIHKVIGQVSDNAASRNRNNGYGLIAATFFIYAGIALSRVHYTHTQNRLITKIRGALISIIYHKTLQLSLTGADTSAALTLMSTDTDRICFVLQRINELWAGIIEFAIATFLLEQQVGAACVAPAFVGLICILLSSALSQRSPKYQRTWFQAIQRRVAVTSDTLNNIKSIKSMGVLPKIAEILQAMRAEELKLSANYRWFTVCFNMLGMFVKRSSLGLETGNEDTDISVQGQLPMIFLPIVTFSFYATSNILTFDVSRAFTALSIISLMSMSLLDVVANIPELAAAATCFDRIQAFLAYDECNASEAQSRLTLIQYDQNDRGSNKASPNEETIPRIQQTCLPMVPLTPALSTDTIVKVTNADFTAIQGRAPILKDISFACGLGSLSAIVGPAGSGKTMLIHGLLGEAVLVKGAVILNCKSLAYCGQESWLSNTTIQDNILFGCTYDNAWYHSVLHACVLDQDIISFRYGDKTLVGTEGINLSGGQKQRVALARALYSRKRLVFLDDSLSGLDNVTEQLVFERVLGVQGLFRQQNVTVIYATHSDRLLRFADQTIVLNKEGRIVEVGSYESFKSFGANERKLKTSHLCQEEPLATIAKVETGRNGPNQDAIPSKQSDATDFASRRAGDFSTYRFYFRSIGWLPAILFISYTAIRATFALFPQVWLKRWAESNTAEPGKDLGIYLGLYVFFGTLGVVSVGVAIAQLFITIVPKSAKSLHRMLLSSVASATYAFSTSTDSGTILNRFSQDMSLIDVQLPISLLTTTTMLSFCVGSAVLIVIGAKYAAALIPLCIGILYLVQKFYLRTSRQLRLLELEAKAPLFTHFTETLSGLATIRAFDHQGSFLQRGLELLDASQRPFYFLFCIQRWLNLVLDLVIAGLAVALVALAVELPGTTSGGAIGIALVNVLNYNQLLAELITAWTSLETSIGAVARVRNFVKETEQETQPSKSSDVAGDWPAYGTINIQGITASYRPNCEPVLKDLSLNIKPGEKVGICGRSGGGKSSLILVLLRLLDLSNGTISIDNIPINEVNREDIRSRLNVLPQDPVILPGSLRFNMDPSGSSSDTQIVSVLKRVDLWDAIHPKGGLDSEIDAVNFSHGQLQLMAFARAMIRKGQILIMDEATSSLDEDSEALINQLIREEFADKTVLAVAHRLRTIRYFDRVAVLHSGRIAESGKPDDLLETENGYFRRLWETNN